VDVGASYRRSVERWAALVAGASSDWSAPTPCSEWDVRQLVNHMVYEDRWTKPLMEGKTIAEVGDAFEGDLLGDAPTENAIAAAEEALDSVETRLPQGGKVHLSYGEEDLSEYISQLLADHLIHGWDLAAATGQDRTLDPELVDAATAWFRRRQRLYQSIGAVADPPATAAGGTPQNDLLIAFGRDPDWKPAPSTAT
jgi:uncharacterized protein (TIGR03086 family)